MTDLSLHSVNLAETLLWLVAIVTFCQAIVLEIGE